MLDEVRAAGSQKKGTSLAGCMTADLIVLLREIPTGKVESVRVPQRDTHW